MPIVWTTVRVRDVLPFLRRVGGVDRAIVVRVEQIERDMRDEGRADVGPVPVNVGPALADVGPAPADVGPALADVGPALADVGPAPVNVA